MPFRARNRYYLKITSSLVLPLFVYLDDRHLDWMSDLILQHVLTDLRPNILPKLQAEASARTNLSGPAAKKLSVDTHRGEFYQFCYFLSKTEPHSVLIKNRVFTAASASKSTKKRKLSAQEDDILNRKKRKRKGKAKQVSDDQVSDSDVDSDSDEVEIVDDSPGAMDIHLDVEEEEEKPKPIMNLCYQGFNIYDHCLCVVVEPWPTVRGQSRAPSIAPSSVPGRASSIAPADFVAKRTSVRSKTPLFLPDDDDDDLPIFLGGRTLPPVPRFNDATPHPHIDDIDIDDDDYGMMELSQVLSSAGDLRAGAMEDEEIEDNAVFFADADEIRELS